MLLVEGHSTDVSFSGLHEALAEPDVQLRLFGKPEVAGERRMGVVLALADDVDTARAKATSAASHVRFHLR